MQTQVKERPINAYPHEVRAILEERQTQMRRVMKPQPPPTMTEAVLYLNNSTWCFTGPQRDADGNPLPVEQWKGGWPDCGPGFASPYGAPGDRLWVRETFAIENDEEYGCDPLPSDRPIRTVLGDEYCGEHHLIPRYRATEPDTLLMIKETDSDDPSDMMIWTPSIHMPRWASRIALEITDVRVQPLQEISEEDAMAEGCEPESVTEQDVADVLVSDCAPFIKEMARILGPGQFTAKFAFQKLWESINAKTHPWASNPWVLALTFRRVQP